MVFLYPVSTWMAVNGLKNAAWHLLKQTHGHIWTTFVEDSQKFTEMLIEENFDHTLTQLTQHTQLVCFMLGQSHCFASHRWVSSFCSQVSSQVPSPKLRISNPKHFFLFTSWNKLRRLLWLNLMTQKCVLTLHSGYSTNQWHNRMSYWRDFVCCFIQIKQKQM